MRNLEGGMPYIEALLNRLGSKHELHIECYGNNDKRLTGLHETSDKSTFSYGVGNRAASCRIPTTTAAGKTGYIEDRRPASDIDPYVSCALLFDTTCLEESKFGPLLEHYRRWREWRLKTNIELL
jgi:glutamine synthetase